MVSVRFFLLKSQNEKKRIFFFTFDEALFLHFSCKLYSYLCEQMEMSLNWNFSAAGFSYLKNVFYIPSCDTIRVTFFQQILLYYINISL